MEEKEDERLYPCLWCGKFKPESEIIKADNWLYNGFNNPVTYCCKGCDKKVKEYMKEGRI